MITMIDQLRSNFRDLLSFIDVNDKIESDETVSSKTASSSVCLQEKLISILNILKRLEQQLIPKNDDDGCNEDNKVVDVDGGNFIRTNLANYNDKQSNAAENSSSTQQLSLRNIFESQSFVTQVLHFLTQLMNDNDNFFTDENDNDNHHNGPSFISLLACQIYLQTSLVQGSWSVGWIDMVAIRYVETTLRKWNLFCCEYKLNLSSTNDDNEDEDNELRMKRSKYNQDEENTAVDEDGDDNRSFCDRKIIHEKIQHGIELSKALSHILRQCDQCSFWNWNIEARDALFDSTILAFGTCSALLSQGFDILPTHKGVLKILCQDTVRDLCHSLEKVVISSVDEGNFAIQNNNEDTDDLDEFQSPNPIVNEENIATLLPIPRSTLVTLLRNIYPLLECKTDLPNGVKGKHATFERCQSVIAKIVQSLSSKVKMIDSSDGFSMTFKSMNGSIHTPRTKRRHDNVGDTITPLTGHRGINRRLSVTPKSTNRKKILQSRNGLNTLIVAPSLKKSITPTRSSRRRSLMLQHSYSALSSKNTQRKKKDEIKDMHIKEMLDILVGLMQKISTCSNMERVEVRTRISAFNSCMLENMRGFYRNPFIKFLTKLTNSKVSTHRIFSVELLCSILSTQWFWDDECIHKKRNDRMNLSVDEEENESEVVSSIDVKQSNNSNEFPKNQSISFSIGEESNKRTLVSKEIFDALQGRITDRSPAVRARVAIALSAAFGDLKSLVSESNDIQTIILNSINSIRSTLISSLRQRAKCDTKATVRRAASMAFVDLILISESDNIVGGNEFNLTQIDINVLCQLCSDSSVAVRKVAVDAIVKLMERQHCHSESHLKYEIGSLESAWVDSILPLVRDVEHSCVAKVIDSFETLIVAPIVEIEDDFLDDEKTRNTDRRHMSFWKIMCILNHESASSGPSTGSKNAFKLVMRKAFEVLDTQKRKRVCVTILRKLHAVVSSNVNHNEDSLDEKVTGAWCMLESIASLDSNMNMKPITNLVDVLHVSNIGTDFLTLSCNSLLKRCNEENIESKKTTLVACAKSCINVVSSFARVMEAEQITELALVLKNAIKSFALVIDLIGLSTTALVALADALCSGKTDNAIVPTCTKWIQEIYYQCEANLGVFISSALDQGNIDYVALSRVIFTTGEMSLIGFDRNDDNASHQKKAKGSNHHNPIHGLNVKPSTRLTQLIQTLLPPTLPSVHGVRGKDISHVLRAHAFIAFGKLCLRDESLTKESLDIFAQELQDCGSMSNEAVRSNALLVLGDLCVCYAHLVDKFISLMASCLQPRVADSSIVQQHAIILFANLLLQDYIKWKGALFYRFVSASVTKDPVVANLAKGLLCGPLLTKQPNLFSNNFIGAVFILNGCKSHPIQIMGAIDEEITRTSSMLTLKIDDFNDRFKIYHLLLDQMTDEEKIAITARLSKDVLQAAIESTGYLSQAASAHGGVQHDKDSRLYGSYNVLSDCLSILFNPRLHVGKSKQHELQDDEDLNATMASLGPNSSQLSSMKGKLLSKMSRKHMIETVFPILCSLKVILEKSRSPLLKKLMEYLVCIFRQFKQEVNDVLASDITLLQEIQYDTRQFEKNQRNENMSEIQVLCAQ